MPINLRDTDIAVLNALLKDGRKSFRQISKDTGLSTPTVKNRFTRSSKFHNQIQRTTPITK